MLRDACRHVWSPRSHWLWDYLKEVVSLPRSSDFIQNAKRQHPTQFLAIPKNMIHCAALNIIPGRQINQSAGIVEEITVHFFEAGSPLRQAIDGCICYGLMSTDPDKLIGTKLSFQMNRGSLCGTLRAAFVLDAMPVNATFQSALSNDIVAEHSELWFGVRFRIMDDLIYYELRVISKATGTSVKCYRPKSLLSFKASQEISFSRIMHAHMLQRLLELSVQPNTCNFLGL
ncbi:transposable element Tcb1 transposase [Trichonephila clavipes]|uniref:Transposable element Tcb1 transposase n=1 Tax=Trichonephila clavipes TaxID=2585209 RepID=A0A8X6W6G8_TRICX|nr:transposable element Tcb1 transposase [Trichonephila clavipes]